MELKIILCARGKGQIQDLRIAPLTYCAGAEVWATRPALAQPGTAGACTPYQKCAQQTFSWGGSHVPGLAAESGPLPLRLSSRAWRPLKEN